MHCVVYYIHKLPLLIVAEVLVLLYVDLFILWVVNYFIIIINVIIMLLLLEIYTADQSTHARRHKEVGCV